MISETMLQKGKLVCEINGGILSCNALGWNPEEVIFHYKVQRNAVNFAEKAFSHDVSAEFEIKEKGTYTVWLTVADCEKTCRYIAPVQRIEYYPVVFDWKGRVAHKALLYASGKAVLGNRYEQGKSGANGHRRILLDFLSEAVAFAGAHSEQIGIHRKLILDDEDVQSELTSLLESFKSQILEEIKIIAQSYGENNVSFIRLLISDSCVNADKINWLLEELYDYLNRREIRECVCLPNTVEIQNGEVVLDEIEQQRVREGLEDYANYALLTETGDIKVNVKLCDNELTASIKTEFPEEDDSYAFYLLRYENVVDKVEFSKGIRQHTWKLEKPGIYVVRGYVKHDRKNRSHNSQAVSYMPESIEKEYRDFLNSDEVDHRECLNEEELEFIPQKGPFYDYAIVTGLKDAMKDFRNCYIGNKKKNMPNISNGTWHIGAEEIALISEMDMRVVSGGGSVSLSGIASIDGRSVKQDDIESLSEDVKNKLIGATGCFTSIMLDQTGLRIHSDYFNFQQIYYWFGEGITVFSNRYHLLLEILRTMGVKLKLFWEKAAVLLSANKVQLLCQGYLREMDMHGCYQLDCGQDAVLDCHGWSFVRNEYGKAIDARDVYHKDKYRLLLKEAKEELRHNMEGVFGDENYKKVHLDLSGGLDSRVVFEAATMLTDDQKKKIDIVSKDVPGSKDIDIALKVNSLYCFPWDTAPASYYEISILERERLRRSFYMGRKYDALLGGRVYTDRNEVELNGACGEIVARPYVSRNNFEVSRGARLCIDKYVQYFIEKNSIFSYVGHDAAFSYFEKQLKKEMEAINRESFEEKLEKVYLMYRHAYHFDYGVQNYFNNQQISPMQLKKLFRLHNMTFNIFRSIKLQLDFLNLINPVVASVAYESERDNTDKERLYDHLIQEDERYRNMIIKVSGNEEEWLAAQREKERNQTHLGNGDTVVHRPCSIGENELLKNGLYQSFKKLMKYSPELSEMVGCELFYLFKYVLTYNSRYARYIYNKMVSLTDQIELVG